MAGLAFLVFALDLFLPEGRKNLLAFVSMAGLSEMIVLSLVLLRDEDK